MIYRYVRGMPVSLTKRPPARADSNPQTPPKSEAAPGAGAAPAAKRGGHMVKVSRLQGKEFYVNPDMIEFMEETPDLVVSMISGKKLIVEGSAEELTDRIVAYRVRTHGALPKAIRRGRETDLELEPGLD